MCNAKKKKVTKIYPIGLDLEQLGLQSEMTEIGVWLPNGLSLLLLSSLLTGLCYD